MLFLVVRATDNNYETEARKCVITHIQRPRDRKIQTKNKNKEKMVVFSCFCAKVYDVYV